MGKRINYKKGDVINGHVYLREADKSYSRKVVFICRYCGEEGIASPCLLKTNRQKSCGCLKRISRNPYYMTKLYRLWDKVKQRCYNPNANNYHNYGGRGITVYSKWISDPSAFIEYCMTLSGHNDKTLSLDRIKTDGNYEPGNLRFATRLVQNRNRRAETKNESGYVGVIKREQVTSTRYAAHIHINNKSVNVGVFSSSKEAATARDKYIIDNNLEGFNLQVL